MFLKILTIIGLISFSQSSSALPDFLTSALLIKAVTTYSQYKQINQQGFTPSKKIPLSVIPSISPQNDPSDNDSSILSRVNFKVQNDSHSFSKK